MHITTILLSSCHAGIRLHDRLRAGPRRVVSPICHVAVALKVGSLAIISSGEGVHPCLIRALQNPQVSQPYFHTHVLRGFSKTQLFRSSWTHVLVTVCRDRRRISDTAPEVDPDICSRRTVEELDLAIGGREPGIRVLLARACGVGCVIVADPGAVAAACLKAGVLNGGSVGKSESAGAQKYREEKGYLHV